MRTLKLSQPKYIQELAERFLTSNSRSMFTPVHSSKTEDFMKISDAKDDLERVKMREKPYLALMGALLWATNTRPEIAFYVAKLATHMADPSIEAYEAGLDIVSYLRNTPSLGITYDASKLLMAPILTNFDSFEPLPN